MVGEKASIMLRYLVECEHGKFDCGNSRCLSNEQVCDYFDNCADGTRKDERNCDYPPGKLCEHLKCTVIAVDDTAALSAK